MSERRFAIIDGNNRIIGLTRIYADNVNTLFTDGSANIQEYLGEFCGFLADLPYGTQKQNPGQDPQLSLEEEEEEEEDEEEEEEYQNRAREQRNDEDEDEDEDE
jgi:hypothetical protein